MMRICVLVLACACLGLTAAPKTSTAAEAQPTAADRYMDLGTAQGELGGADQKAFEHEQLKAQIKTFIPPLLRPAFVEHAYVLPPKVWSVSVSERFARIKGNDFFLNGNADPVFRDMKVDRNFTDFDIFYGFDLNREYLHDFTVRLNVPYLDSKARGSVFPVAGMPFPNPENIASSQEIGDIGLFLKKKLLDQGTFPVGLAVAGGVFLSTGRNDEKFGSNGRVNVKVPPGMIVGADMNGNINMPFQRFSDDGRLPSTLQPGTGGASYLVGAFLTRQFSHTDLPGRSALHVGATRRFVSEHDGIDFGDTTTVFASFVKPIYRDYLAADLTFVGFDQKRDKYSGLFAQPGTGVDMVGMPPGSNPAVMIPRPAFSGGRSGFIAPSLIFSPDPQIRATLSGLVRVVEPDLGPSPRWVIRAGLEVTF